MAESFFQFISNLYPYGILPAVSGMIILLIAINIYIRRSGNKISSAASLLCLGIAFWIINGASMTAVSGEKTAAVLKEFYFLFWLLLPILTFYFITSFSGRKSVYLYLFTITAAVLIPINFIFKMSSVQHGYFGYYPRLDFPMNYIGNIYYFSCTSAALLYLYDIFLHAKGSTKKNQARLLLTGISIGFMLSVTESLLVLSEGSGLIKGSIHAHFFAVNYSLVLFVILSYMFILFLFRSADSKRFKFSAYIRHPAVIVPVILSGSTVITFLMIEYSYPLYPVKDAGIITAMIFVSYAILKYRVVDITELFRNYFIYILQSVIFLSAYFIIISQVFSDEKTITLVFVFALIIVIVFNPLQFYLQKLISSFITGVKYDYHNALTEVSTKLVTVLDYNKLIDTVTDAVVVNLKLSSFALLTLDDEKGLFSQASLYGINKPVEPVAANHPLINFLRLANREIFLDELSDDTMEEPVPEYTEFFHSLKAVLVIPMIYKGSLRGIFALGEKKSGEIYNMKDISLLQVTGNQLSIALDNARLYELAIRDGLTKLFISRFFHQRLTEEIILSMRQKRSISLLMIDLDHFKSVNDTYGHPIGDVILKESARIIMDQVRVIDLVARYGGEEFAVILPETGNDLAVIIAERIRKTIENQNFIHGIRKTISSGISTLDCASFDQEFESGSAVTRTQIEDYAGRVKTFFIKKTDKALYQAKDGGRNNCVNAGIISGTDKIDFI